MKPVKAVILLTIPRFFLLWFFIATVSLQSNAQCGSPNKISYHVTLSGTGNNSWGFVFPQFDPSVGTLVAVDIRSEISVNVNFQLFNIGASADTYTVLAGRNDNLTVSALSSPISNAYPVDYGPYILQAITLLTTPSILRLRVFWEQAGSFLITILTPTLLLSLEATMTCLTPSVIL